MWVAVQSLWLSYNNNFVILMPQSIITLHSWHKLSGTVIAITRTKCMIALHSTAGNIHQNNTIVLLHKATWHANNCCSDATYDSFFHMVATSVRPWTKLNILADQWMNIFSGDFVLASCSYQTKHMSFKATQGNVYYVSTEQKQRYSRLCRLHLHNM